MVKTTYAALLQPSSTYFLAWSIAFSKSSEIPMVLGLGAAFEACQNGD